AFLSFSCSAEAILNVQDISCALILQSTCNRLIVNSEYSGLCPGQYNVGAAFLFSAKNHPIARSPIGDPFPIAVIVQPGESHSHLFIFSFYVCHRYVHSFHASSILCICLNKTEPCDS